MIASKTCRFVDTDYASAALNMAVGEALLENFNQNDLPTLRLCQWAPSVSVGRYSEIFQSIEKQEVQRQRLSSVHRITGSCVLVHTVKVE